MAKPWTFAGVSASLGRAGGAVTLIEETSFCLSDRSGDIQAGKPQGVFALDTRLLSRLELRVGGHQPEPLSVASDAPFAATFALRTHPHGKQADSRLMVLRRRSVSGGLRETVELRNYSTEELRTTVTLEFTVDFADLFAVKEDRVDEDIKPKAEVDGDEVRFSSPRSSGVQHVRVEALPSPDAQGGELTADRAQWHVVLPPHGRWSGSVSVSAYPDDGNRLHASHGTARDRLAEWRQTTPSLRTHLVPLRTAYRQSLADVGSLRLFDTTADGLPVVAAGAPWFMTLFGRDSLLTAYMALLVAPDLALGVLHKLAGLQGGSVDERTEEQPGRILHEVRYDGSSVYYGTADATPLFVLLLGECLRWGLPWERLEPLVANADRALDWVEHYGDRDGDGYVEYQRMTPEGLENQGWKDSWDAIVFADGRLAEPPIALCEVQGYVYAAYRARAALARQTADILRAEECEERTAALRERFNRDFWLPERGCFALALDGNKTQVDAVASNMGHCLWTGIATPEHAAAVARHLTSPEVFSGWGVRTLAASMASYNPMSYHCGSVWPHDTAIAVAGLMRYGFVEDAQRIALALLDAAAADDGRLSELFTGLARDDVRSPVSYPSACSPQAWSAAAPLLLLRALLRLDPDVPAGRLFLDPALPEQFGEVVLDGVPLAGCRLTITGTGAVQVTGAPPAVEVVRALAAPPPR
jgi:glycogen debranching enzyme